MGFKDLLKRQVGQLLETDTGRHTSLADDIRNELDRGVADAIDPGRELRESQERAADLERTRTQPGFGQFVQIDGLPGQWEAVELLHFDDTAASFTLVDRLSGETAALHAVDDGTVLLDSPGDQHGANVVGAFWRTPTQTGIRLAGVELTADGVRRVRVTCDLRANTPVDEPEYTPPDYGG